MTTTNHRMEKPSDEGLPSAGVLGAVLDSPEGLVIFALDRDYRYIAFNAAHRYVMKQIWNVDIHLGQNMLMDVIGREDDRAKAKAQFDRALAGEPYVIVDDYGDDQYARRSYENSFAPLKDASGEVFGLSCFLADVTIQRRTEEELAQYRADLAKRNEELAERVEENARLVSRLQEAVEELSTPVLEVWDGVLALPVIGAVDADRGAHMEARLLQELVATRSQFVILDLTGVSTVDSHTADRIGKMASAVGLLGSECILTGLQPAVAQTLVAIGVEFGKVRTERNLKRGIEICMSLIRQRKGAGRTVR